MAPDMSEIVYDDADFTGLLDLASERVGGAVLLANDEFFAEKENLLRHAKPVFIEDRYTDRGKWMDGWESRRRRPGSPGGDPQTAGAHDWCIVRLGLPGVVRGVVVDTAFFRGNFPESCSIEAACVPGTPDLATIESADWVEILPRSTLRGDSRNLFPIDAPLRVTHLRLRIFPDGGVARLRVHGEADPEWKRLFRVPEIDLAASENGAFVTLCSDMFFGSRNNLIAPGTPANMGEGWETRRRRGPGHDWAIVRLATEGVIRRVELDTTHFKGNAPDSCVLESSAHGDPEGSWDEFLPLTKLRPDTRHYFDAIEGGLRDVGPARFVRIRIFPDGGVARLRLRGVPSDAGRAEVSVRRLNRLFPAEAAKELLSCCGSLAWAREMAARRPFPDVDAVLDTADAIWADLGPDDWHEAFRAHPRIGERKTAGDAQFRAWSDREQAGARVADQDVLEALAEGNRAYEERFGHIYIVCASGRSGETLLGILRERLGNTPAAELRVAAEEQRKITRIRLERLLAVNP
jgi:allantoicase